MNAPEQSSCSMAFALTYGRGTNPSAGGKPSSPGGDAPSGGSGVRTDQHIGSVFGGRYKLEARLAEGAMGAVYRARHVTLGSQVAVKVLHERLATDSAVSQRFDREAEAEAQLDHPNCVQVLDAGVTETGTKYLVMPLLAGAELRDLMAGPMDLHRATDLCLQILEGLDHAHRRGFVHRDVKPENVFVVRTDDGHELAKLVDFGLVKALDADASRPVLTEAGKVFGTPWYMSPEQAVGSKIDVRSDLYSLGAMVFEMLSGAPPFDAGSFSILLRKHLLSDVPQLPSSVPPLLAAFVYRLLEKEPEARYETARAASDALRHAMLATAGEVSPAASASFVAQPAPIFSEVPSEPAFVGAPSLSPSRLGAGSSDDWVLQTSFGDERSESVLSSARAQGRLFRLMGGFLVAAGLVFGLVVGLGGQRTPPRATAPQGVIAAVSSDPAPEQRSDHTGLVAEAEARPVETPAAEPRAVLTPEPTVAAPRASPKPRAKARPKSRRRWRAPARPRTRPRAAPPKAKPATKPLPPPPPQPRKASPKPSERRSSSKLPSVEPDPIETLRPLRPPRTR